MIAGQPVVIDGVPFVVVDVDATERGTCVIVRPLSAPDQDDDHDLVLDPDDDRLLEVVCGWFALCTATAVGLENHPVLGPVPICDRCHDKIAQMR